MPFAFPGQVMPNHPGRRRRKALLSHGIFAGPPSLVALSLSPNTANVGAPYSGTVTGKTSGSTLSLTGAGSAGLSVVGSTVSGTPTTEGAVNIVETLAGATNSPRTSVGVLITGGVGPVMEMVVAFGPAQSNGRDAGNSSATAPAALSAALGDVYMWRGGDATPSFQPYRARVNSEQRNAANAYGAEAYMALLFKAAFPGTRINFVKGGVNGTQLAANAGLSTWAADGSGTLFEQWIADVIAALAEVTSRGKTPELVIVKQQGEADAFDNTGALGGAYNPNWTAAVAATRLRTGQPNARVITMRIRPMDYQTTQGGTVPYYRGGHLVREADCAVAAADPTRSIVVSTDYARLTEIHPGEPTGDTWQADKGARLFAAINGTHDATYGSALNTVPNAFAFPALTGATAGTVVRSPAITLTGFERRSPVSVSGCEWRTVEPSVEGLYTNVITPGTDWTSAAGFIDSRFQTLQVRATSGAAGVTTSPSVTVGGVTAIWSITSEASPSTYRSDTNAYLATVAANNGKSLNATERAGVEAYFVAKAASTWGSALLSQQSDFGDAISARINLADQTTVMQYLANAGGSRIPYTAGSGFNPGAVSARGLNTAVNPSVSASQNSVAFGMYYKAMGTSAVPDYGSSDLSLSARVNADGTGRVRINSANINFTVAGDLSNQPGYRLFNRSGAATNEIYGPAGTLIKSPTNASTGNTATNMILGQSSTTGNAAITSTYSFSRSLTGAEVADHKNATLAALTVFGSN